MIYIEYDNEYVINYIHYNPFDEVYGFDKLPEELLLTGAIVDDFRAGKISDSEIYDYKYDPIENTVYRDAKKIKLIANN